jgi:hypothetical protein
MHIRIEIYFTVSFGKMIIHIRFKNVEITCVWCYLLGSTPTHQ